MIKVLGLTLYGPLAASTRYRVSQYAPGLLNFGIDIQVRSLLVDDYIRHRFNGGIFPLKNVFTSALNRLIQLYNQDEYDLIFLYSELFPLMPGIFESNLIRIPFIYDFDDAFYLKYRNGKLGLASPILGRKFDKVISCASYITAGNHVLAKYALQFNSNVQYLPTVVDTSRYLPRQSSNENNVLTIGWIGSPSTAFYLNELIDPLSNLGLESSVRFVVVGGKAPVIPNVNVVEVDWSESTELDLIKSFDVGVMPLPDNEWARGKCAFKLIQYMACGIPVIASPIGANVELVTKECGLMASTSFEWLNAFRKMRDHLEMRNAMALACRERVVSKYSLHNNLPILANTIYKILNLNSEKYKLLGDN